MRVIIAGGRDYAPRRKDVIEVIRWLDAIGATEIVSGGAHGADTFGELIAWGLGLPMTRFEADWKQYGKQAGMIRNAEMARNADAVVLMPGGAGTANMHSRAKSLGLKIHDLRGF